MVSRDEHSGTLSGLTDAEAKEFHAIFVTSFTLFVIVAIAAHVLAWLWRPWIPGPGGWAQLETGVHTAQLFLSNLIG
jgi:light-harvesting complex 1 beta chain